MKPVALLSFILILLAGCTLPLRPGKSTFKSASGMTGTIRQSQNPSQPSTQVYERIVEPGVPVAGQVQVTTRTIERITTTIGAAQKDAAREVGAKLAGLRPVMWVGIVIFLFGAASFVYPPLKLIVGSVTTSAVLAGAGLAMIVLPTLIVGNEILILSVAGGAAALWFLAHRHGKVSTTAKILTEEKNVVR